MVIIIIGVLASLVVLAVTGAMRNAKNESTTAMLETIKGALESYRTRWGDFPPSTLGKSKAPTSTSNDLNAGAEALVACLSSKQRGGICYLPPNEAHYLNMDADEAPRNLTDWHFGDNQLREFGDFWQRPIVYIHHRDYEKTFTYKFLPGEKAKTFPVKAEKSSVTKAYSNPGKFQLLSVGEDAEPGTDDDIRGY